MNCLTISLGLSVWSFEVFGQTNETKKTSPPTIDEVDAHKTVPKIV